LFAAGAYLVFEKLAQRLDELEVHLLGQSPHVVVALDDRARTLERHALDDVGVQRALYEPPRARTAPHLLRLFVEHLDEDAANGLSFFLGVRDATQSGEKALARIDRDQIQTKALAEGADYLLRLA